MKLIKLLTISTLIIAALSFAGCYYPFVPVEDIDDPVAVVLTVPVAVFYYNFASTIQTDSWVVFNGSDSHDPDDEIMRGRWDFDGEFVKEGIWTTMEQKKQNGELVWVWTDNVSMQKVSYQFKEAKTYTVTLTVWDYDGNEDSVTREVIVK